MATPTIKFFPNVGKKNKEDGLVPVYIRLLLANKKVEGKTPLYLNEQDVMRWDSDYLNFNSKVSLSLIEYRQRFKDFILENVRSGKPLCLTKLRDYVLNRNVGDLPVTVKSYVEAYYKNHVLTDSLKTEGTKGNYKKAYTHFYKFLEQRGTPNLLFEEIQPRFDEEFKEYLFSSNAEKKKKPVVEPTACGYVKKLITVFERAFSDRKIDFLLFVKLGLKPDSPLKEKLSIEQIQRIVNLDLDSKTELGYARLLFLAQIFSGLAYGDIVTLAEENLEPESNDYYMRKKRVKTGIYAQQVTTTYFSEFIRLFKNRMLNNGTVFPMLDNKTYNEHLKTITILAKIPFALTTHHGRHAFAQLLEEAEIEDAKVMYGMMGWSKRAHIDYKYNFLPKKKLLRAKNKLDVYLDNHLGSNEFIRKQFRGAA